MGEIKILIGSSIYNQIQINGERITTKVGYNFGSTSEPNPMEICIHGIPFDIYEDHLIPLFETIGVVVQFRLMMEYSGHNRGSGYITYAGPTDGHRAIAHFNNFMVTSLCKLQLFVSKIMRRLWLGHVAEELDVNSVIDLIHEKVEPEEVFVCQQNGQRHFVLKFPTHRDAADARRRLIQEVTDFGMLARANWDFHQSRY